jgi:hypothetical protein
MRSKDIQAMPAAMLRCTPLTSIDGEGDWFKRLPVIDGSAPLHLTPRPLAMIARLRP